VLERQCVVRKGSKCELNPDGSAQAGSQVVVNQPRNFHDTFGVRASGSYWPSGRVELLAGVGYSSNAIPASTYEPALLDGNEVSVSAGTIVAVIPRLSLGFGYMQLVYFDRSTVGRSVAPTLAGPSHAPDPGGKYSVLAGVFNVTADFSF
jgi:long-subunit fatty acid transport protein